MDLELMLNALFREMPLTEEEAYDNAKYMLEYFQVHIDPDKLEEDLQLMFVTNENRLQDYFLEKLAVKSYNSVTNQLLQLIKFLLCNGITNAKWKSEVLPYCLEFKKIANLYWRCSREAAKNQQTALECIIAMLEHYTECVDEANFELPSLYWELLPASEKSSFQPSVRGKIFHVLALIAAVTRNGFFKEDKLLRQLHRHIVHTVQSEVESRNKHLEIAILQGCLKAMDKLLQCFSSRIIKGDVQWNQFYKNLAQIVDPKASIASGDQPGLKRREFQRVGLELIGNNAVLFNKELFHHYKQWYLDISEWSKSNNSNDSHAGRKAMFAFLKTVFDYAKCLSESDQPKPIILDEFLTYFVETFDNILSSENHRRSESIIAITGIGLLSPICAKTPKGSVLTERILNNVRNITVELNNPVADKYSGSLYMVPTYLECVSSLLQFAMDESEDPVENARFLEQFNFIEQLTVQLLTFYPDLSEYQRKNVHHCFLKLVNSLKVKHEQHCIPFLDRVLKCVMSQVIASYTAEELKVLKQVWISHTERNADEEMIHKGVTCYLGVWVNLANSNCEEYPVRLVYDRLMMWALSEFDKLDLTMIPLSEPEESELETQIPCPGDVISNTMKAKSPKDFKLLINLLEVLHEFLSRSEKSLFKTWIPEFISKVMAFSAANPLVRGFYKLLATIFDVCNKLDFFINASVRVPEIFEKCNVFMKSVLDKMDEFKDDLLVAVLEYWLSVPDDILIQQIIHNVEDWSSTLQKIFRDGRFSLCSVDKSLDVLQKWTSLASIPREILENIVSDLVPIWQQCYFVSEAGNQAKRIKLSSSPLKSQTNPDNSDDCLLETEDTESRKSSQNDEADNLVKVQTKMKNIMGTYGHDIDTMVPLKCMEDQDTEPI